MYAGRIVEIAETRELFKNPLHPYTRGLLQAVPKLGKNQPLSFVPGIIPDLVNPPSGCRFHSRCGHAMDITMILNNLGAQVIKIEAPEKGDDARHFGPFINGDPDKSAYFYSINCGKKSICLDLKTTRCLLAGFAGKQKHPLCEN